MKGKISFVGGMAIGLLIGSKIGPRLYQQVTGTVSSLAADPRVRQTASSASDKAAHAARNAGTTAANQVKHASEVVANRFGDRFNHDAHATANGAGHGVSRFDEDPLAD